MATKKPNPKERRAFAAFWRTLTVKKRRTKRPMIVGMIGLVGSSGRSSVAKAIAARIGGTVIEADVLRVKLRKLGAGYDHMRTFVETAAREVLARGGNPVLDSDFADAAKRRSAAALARKTSARLHFVRVIADRDVMIGRTVHNAPSLFFRGASANWHGSDRERGLVVKLREFWRRTPLHYTWNPKGGGSWKLKPLRGPITATIDTTNGQSWKKAVVNAAKKLI
ncbi:MAG: hypothetical protein HYT40_04055 [Candidatus Sungbacteria bacterium]|uniref:Uncharacterized protein n=1 Tax=Candidatus Sungiibacteriota bacterium TaxID=2750080 RepID=A0A931WNF7_9BACT|nr:hypothetical protein [Candidatus Sungbacteria bacterium]